MTAWPPYGAALAMLLAGSMVRREEDQPGLSLVALHDAWSAAGEALPRRPTWRGVMLDEPHDRPINPFESRQVRRARLRREARKERPHGN